MIRKTLTILSLIGLLLSVGLIQGCHREIAMMFPNRLTPPKTLKQKLKDGDLFTAESAAAQIGYTVVHLRRLCHAKKIDHIRRGDDIFFTPAQVEAVFKPVKARKA